MTRDPVTKADQASERAGRRPGAAVVTLDGAGSLASTAATTLAERVARGRAARAVAPRSSHAEWRARTDRMDPVEILERQAQERVPELIPIRYGRMAASPFAFYRGAAAIMAADLADSPVSGLTVQLCGDAHLMNFGAYAGPDRRLVFDVNDFDETLPGPWEWDVKRLAASVTIATREIGRPESYVRRATLAAVRGYRVRMRDLAEQTNLGAWYARIDVEKLRDAMPDETLRDEVQQMIADAGQRDRFRSLQKLTEVRDGTRRFVDEPPVIARLSPEHEETVREILTRYPPSLPRSYQAILARYTLADVAHKVVGVGSVGLTAFVAFYTGRDDADPFFLQLKEARRSALEDHLPKSRKATPGQRVVDGQQLMQATGDIFLGHVRGRSGRHFYVRQLTDMKWSADLARMSRRGLGLYVWLCGEALARAHARSGDRIAIAGYLGGSDRFDEAVADFAAAYADQNRADYEALLAAIGSGRITARSL